MLPACLPACLPRCASSAGMWRSRAVAVKVVLHLQADCLRVDRELNLSSSLQHDNVVATLFTTRIGCPGSAASGSSGLLGSVFSGVMALLGGGTSFTSAAVRLAAVAEVRT
jgi:hypothetical protein